MEQSILDKKQAEIQSLLKKWAKKYDVLKPGQKIVFSMRIEGAPLVMAERNTFLNAENIPCLDFFLDISFTELGASKITATIIYRSLYFLITRKNSESETQHSKRSDKFIRNMRDLHRATKREPLYANMKEFLEAYPDEFGLTLVSGIGKNSVKYIMKSLEQFR